MSFTKSELQAIRNCLSKEIDLSQSDMIYLAAIRKNLYSKSDKEDQQTYDYYASAKKVSNYVDSLKKRIAKKNALLKKIKKEISELN